MDTKHLFLVLCYTQDYRPFRDFATDRENEFLTLGALILMRVIRAFVSCATKSQELVDCGGAQVPEELCPLALLVCRPYSEVRVCVRTHA